MSDRRIQVVPDETNESTEGAYRSGNDECNTHVTGVIHLVDWLMSEKGFWWPEENCSQFTSVSTRCRRYQKPPAAAPHKRICRNDITIAPKRSGRQQQNLGAIGTAFEVKLDIREDKKGRKGNDPICNFNSAFYTSDHSPTI